MADANNNPTTDNERVQAARKAGWNPAWGPCPTNHGVAPPVDDSLGHNGITAAEQQRQWALHQLGGPR